MSRQRWIGWPAAALLLAAAGLVVAGGRSAEGDAAGEIAAAQRTETVLSPIYTIDRKYRSMMGPYSEQQILLDGVPEPGSEQYAPQPFAPPEGSQSPSGEPELLWITGYRAVMVGADGAEPMAQEFMCHSNLDIDLAAHEEAWGEAPGFGSRLFTLSQGQFEVRFPPGFGIPVLSSEPLSLTTQVLNLNVEGRELDVRHKVSVEFVRDREVDVAMKALFPTAAYGLALLEGEEGYFGVRRPDEEQHGPGCLVGENAADHEYADPMGRKFTGHWVVKPGREVNRTLVTHLMQLPYDTTIHYIAVHLHPFAESLELRDLTTGETVFRSAARNFEDRIGLSHVDAFSSSDGIPVYRDHEYELVSTYDNTTGEDQDSMAVMYIYLRDLDFEKRRSSRAFRSGRRS